jgi:pimeloyl-ACP methyl ester carboxylesterase
MNVNLLGIACLAGLLTGHLSQAETLRVPADHPTIQAAIDASATGDTVLVAPGTYRERIRLKAGITVRSQGDEARGERGLLRAETTILDHPEGEGPGVEMAEGAVLDGFTITGVGNYDEDIWQHHFTTRGSEQSHEPIGAPGVAGIAVAADGEVRNNLIHHIGYTGITVTGGSPRISGNVCFRNMGGGIGSMNGSSATIEGNWILADTIFESAFDGSEQRYVELVPTGSDGEKPRDVVLAFHGHGSDRWQFIDDPRGECRGVRETTAMFGLILVSPDYRATTSWMGPAAEADVLQIIAELKQRHRIGRFFLAGGSMGGTAALTFAALHPELVAGVCSLNGTANLVEYDNFQEARDASFGGTKAERPDEHRRRSAEFFPERFTMPVAFTTGGRDETVPPDSVQRLARRLAEDGRRVLPIHREEGGHSTSLEDTRTAMEFILREAGLRPLTP